MCFHNFIDAYGIQTSQLCFIGFPPELREPVFFRFRPLLPVTLAAARRY